MSVIDEQGRTEPPNHGDEIETLRGFLHYQRQTLAWKCDGVDSKGLQTTIGPSPMTLGGLLKHMALVEASWTTNRLWDEEMPEPWRSVDWEADRDWDWHSAADDTPAALHTLWREAVTTSEAQLDRALQAGGLDQPTRRPDRSGETRSLRWVLVHLIEEYARHNGHADLLRENADGGAIGE